jgi:threonine aldolase
VVGDKQVCHRQAQQFASIDASVTDHVDCCWPTGSLAAAGLYAIEHNWPLIQRDHDNAQRLANGLERFGVTLTLPVETNQVWIDVSSVNVRKPLNWDYLEQHLKKHGVIVFGGSESTGRLVTHSQTSTAAVDRFLKAFDLVLAQRARDV